MVYKSLKAVNSRDYCKF